MTSYEFGLKVQALGFVSFSWYPDFDKESQLYTFNWSDPAHGYPVQVRIKDSDYDLDYLYANEYRIVYEELCKRLAG